MKMPKLSDVTKLILFDQTSQYLNGLQNKFESSNKHHKSSELNSMVDESKIKAT